MKEFFLTTSQQILKLADPTIQTSGLTPGEVVGEALQVALMTTQAWRERQDSTYRMDAALAVGMSSRQRALYTQLLQLVEQYGQWEKHIGGEGASYFTASYNPYTVGDIKCENCVFYTGNRCLIVSGEIEPEGVCKFWIIPEEILAPFETNEAYMTRDSHDPTKKVVKWIEGLEIGLTHEPGDERHGRKMSAGYGHVRGTYGQAEDGMAIDVYVGSDLESRKVFRISQLRPNGKDFDEFKYVIGCKSPNEAKELYLDHMPKRFFGSIRAVSIDELKPLKKDAAPKEVIRWQGLSIGVTHLPGDRRFPLAVPMVAKYGHLRRSYGAASDGKSLDVYLTPSFTSESQDPIFRIEQRDPATGLRDESKYILGCKSAEEARTLFIRHAGAERFGIVAPADPQELDAYRRDARFHADSCGCEACSRKPRKKKRKPPDEVDADEEGDRSPRVDADEEEPDLADFVVERVSGDYKAIYPVWIDGIRKWAKGFTSLEDMQSALRDNPKPLYKGLSQKPFEDLLFENMMLADLGGQVEVLDEVTRSDSLSLSDSLPRLDARRPEWLRLSFDEAIKALRRRIVIPKSSYRKEEEGYHDWAFSVAKMTRADLVQAVKFIVDQGVSEGKSYDDLFKMWDRLIGRQGWKPSGNKDHRIYTIIDTNVRSSYGTGRGKQMTDPDVMERNSLILWRWRDSPTPRLNHQALHNKAIPSKHRFWRKCRFPCGFGCRCGGFAISEDYAKRNGIEILRNPPDPETIAEPGFRYPLQGFSDSERKAVMDRSMERLSPELRKLVEEEKRSQT